MKVGTYSYSYLIYYFTIRYIISVEQPESGAAATSDQPANPTTSDQPANPATDRPDNPAADLQVDPQERCHQVVACN
jgi:heme-binding NEAT domain protein